MNVTNSTEDPKASQTEYVAPIEYGPHHVLSSHSDTTRLTLSSQYLGPAIVGWGMCFRQNKGPQVVSVHDLISTENAAMGVSGLRRRTTRYGPIL